MGLANPNPKPNPSPSPKSNPDPNPNLNPKQVSSVFTVLHYAGAVTYSVDTVRVRVRVWDRVRARARARVRARVRLRVRVPSPNLEHGRAQRALHQAEPVGVRRHLVRGRAGVREYG